MEVLVCCSSSHDYEKPSDITMSIAARYYWHQPSRMSVCRTIRVWKTPYIRCTLLPLLVIRGIHVRSIANFAFVLLGSIPLFCGRTQERLKDTAQGQSAESSVVALDLQRLVHDYFDLYAKGEVNVMLALW